MIFNAAFALALAAAAAQPVPTPKSLVKITLDAPHAELQVQVAISGVERERGLMGVRRLPRHTGMLFVFAADETVAFWMKDTLVPLDMVFISPQGVVRQIFARVPVLSPATPDALIPTEQGSAKFVLELPAGEAARDGIVPGARIRGLPR